MSRVFVYGSLRRGFHNHGQMRGAKFLGEAVTAPGWALYSLGSFPAMAPSADEGVVVGEVYVVDNVLLTRLDVFEGVEGAFYARDEIRVSTATQSVLLADAYVQSPAQVWGRLRVAGGDWKRWRERQVRL